MLRRIILSRLGQLQTIRGPYRAVGGLAAVFVCMAMLGAVASSWARDTDPAPVSTITAGGGKGRAARAVTQAGPRQPRGRLRSGHSSLPPKQWTGAGRPATDEVRRVPEAAVDALRQAVEQARWSRREPTAQAAPAGSAPRASPALGMTLQQYGVWARFASTLGDRDYKGAERMLPRIRELFGADFATAMEDGLVEDYGGYLDGVIELHCSGFDPDSVWRKTMFMQFALAELNRSTEELEGKAALARSSCGFE